MTTPAQYGNIIRLRALLAGLLLGLAVCAVTPYNNAYLHATPLSGGHFPLAPFFLTFWLAVLLYGLSRLTRTKPLLTGLELLVTWILMVVVSGIGYTGLARTFFINLTAVAYFDDSSNKFGELLAPLLPQGLFPTDQNAIETLYNGLDRGRDMGLQELIANIPWSAWLSPLLHWGGFILLAYLVMLCLVNLFARQWVTNERINFPLLRVPQLMTEAYDEGRFFSFLTDRYLVIGILVPLLLHTLNGLNFYYPSVPRLSTLALMDAYFPKFGFFSGFHEMKIYLYPAFIGFAFLTTRQISFSFWFFYLLGGLMYGVLGVVGLRVPDAALGTTFGPTMARAEEAQMIGAFLVFFVFICWLARQHLVQTARSALGAKAPAANGEASGDEWLPAPVALWGAVLGFLALCAWAATLGMNLLAAVLLLGLSFIFLLVASRVVCQGGVPYFTLTAAPVDPLLAFLGSGFFSSLGLVLGVAMQKVLFVDLRESLMPSLFHASKTTERTKNQRSVALFIGLALILGVVVSFAAMLLVSYKFGLRDMDLDWATRTTLAVYEKAQHLLESPQNPQPWVVTFAIVGGVVMLALSVCYQRFYWWPIHPIGYLMAYSSAMRILWFSFLMGWLVNHLTLHYGGTALFRRVRLFFVGLIIGDFLMGGIFSLVGLYMGQSYNVMPD